MFSYAALSRKVYNWGLERQNEHYETVVKPATERGERVFSLSTKELSAEWTRVRADVLPWSDEVPRTVAQQALRDLDRAFTTFFAVRKAGRRVGYPRFKSRDRSRTSFRCQAARPLDAGHVFLPGIRAIRVKEDPTPRLAGRTIGMATVAEEAGRWFVSFATALEVPEPVARTGSVIGIDLGITTFAVCSDGRRIESPRPLERASDRLAALDRGIARQRNVRDGVRTARMRRRDRRAGLVVIARAVKVEKHARRSVRMVKRQAERARLHASVANQRSNFLHEASTNLVRRHAVIGIEDLAVANLKRNHRLARSISEQGWAQFRFMLTYDGATGEAAIDRLAAAGLTGGCGPRAFCPRDPVTREQMAAFLRRSFGP